MVEKESFETIVGGSPEMVEDLLRLFGEEYERGYGRFRVQRMNNADFPHALDIRIQDNDIIGRLAVIGLPGNRTLIRVPEGRYRYWDKDPQGSFFHDILDYAMRRFREYGLLARRSRLKASGMVDTAIRQLAAADTPEGYSAIGNVCRTALISLGRELFDSGMLASGEVEPPVDAAGPKLKIIARFHWGGRSSRQLDGMKKMIDGTWDICVSFLHRQNATREEAEIAVGCTVQIFDLFSLLVP